MDNKRKSRRLDVGLNARYKTNNKQGMCRLTNMSLNGTRIEFFSPVALHIGTMLELSIDLPNNSSPVQAEVTISRLENSREKNVFGVVAGGKIWVPDPGERQFLARYLFQESLKKVAAAGQ